MEDREIADFLSLSRNGRRFGAEAASAADEVRRDSLSGELLEIDSENEPTYLSPRFRQDYVSSFVAFGRPRESEDFSRDSPVRYRHSSLNASQASDDMLREIQAKDEEIAQLRTEMSALSQQTTAERESLHRDLKSSKRLISDLQHAAKALEATNKRLTHELQLKNQQVESLNGDVETLQEQLSTRERRIKDMEGLRNAHERLAAQWKTERIQLMRELERASTERTKEDRTKRINDIEPLDLTAKFSPSKVSPSGRVRSKSQGKLKRTGKTEDSARGPTSATCRRLIREATALLGVPDPSELLSELRLLQKRAQASVSCDQFVTQICGTVAQLSPAGSFPRQPSLQQVWKWVQRLIDEYMVLRKGREEALQSKQLLQKISDFVGSADIIHQVELWKAIEGEARRLFALGTDLSTRETLAALREHISN